MRSHIHKSLSDHKEGFPFWWDWEIRQVVLDNMMPESKDELEFVNYK